jgi:uncharacterized membrane protein YfcA
VHIFLPVAGRSLNLLFLFGLGAMIGLVSGLFGVGGGFLLTPVLMMAGVPATVAAASGSCQMVATSSSGVAAHFRLGDVDIKMGSLLLLGGLIGAAFGVRAIKDLRVIGEASLVITLTYVVVLTALGSYMFLQSLHTLRRGSIVHKSREAARGGSLLSRLPWQMSFSHSGVRHSLLVPLALATILGVVATIMGVGGGFIMLPMMVYLLGMPTHIAVGTSLFQILFSSAGTTYLQAITNNTVDLVLVLPLAAGSALGAQLGARLSRQLRGEQLMILLATLVLLVAGDLTSGIVLKPSNLLRQSPMISGHEVGRPAPRVPGGKSGLGWNTLPPAVSPQLERRVDTGVVPGRRRSPESPRLDARGHQRWLRCFKAKRAQPHTRFT